MSSIRPSGESQVVTQNQNHSSPQVRVANGARTEAPKTINLNARDIETQGLNSSNQTKGSSKPNNASSVGGFYQVLSEIAGLSQSQRKQDAAAGLSIRDGLSAYSQRMYAAQFAKNTANALGNTGPAAHSAPSVGGQLLAIGQQAQQIQLNQLQTQLMQYGLEQLGIDTSAFSTSAIIDAAAQYLGIGSTSATSTAGAGVISSTGSGGQVGASGVAGSSTASGTSAGTAAANAVGFAASAYSAYQLIDNWGNSTPQAGAIQGASIGAYVGSFFPVVGTAIGAAIGAVVGGIAGSIKSGKHKDQKMRDAVRDFLQNKGMIDQQHQVTLADGSKFDIGKDGRHRYQNIDGTQRAPYQTDMSHPLHAQAIGWIDPLTEVLFAGNEKLRADFTGYFVNAATSNVSDLEGLRANVLSLFSQSGLSPDAVLQGMLALREKSVIDEGRFAAYVHGMSTLFERAESKVAA